MDLKTCYEYFHRDDPSITFRPEHEASYAQRIAWFSRHVPPGAKVLEYGCGQGVVLAGLAERVRLHHDSCGVDISENAVRKAAARFPQLKFVCTTQDGTIPFGESSFDVVVASEVIEHIFDTDTTFTESLRILKPSGTLLLSCPYHGFLKDCVLVLSGQMDNHYHDPYSIHIRYYSMATLRRVLAKHGFLVHRWAGVGRVPFLWRGMVVAAAKPSLVK